MGTQQSETDGGRIAYLFGGDHQSGLVFAGGPAVENRGSTDIWRLRGDARYDFVRIHIPGNFHRIKRRTSLKNVATVLNLITDPDINPNVLGYADQFLKPFDVRVINRPRDVLKSGRDDIAELLSGIDGLIVPKVVRFRGHPNLAGRAIDQVGLPFPAILREIGKHNGDIIGVIASRDELFARIEAKKSYFLTEFVETYPLDGLYHKIRIYFFGDSPVIRHRIVSDHWNVHGPDRERVMVHHPISIARERELIDGGIEALPATAQATLLAIRARIPLDYFGIDFGLMPDGRMLLFEANATMNFFSFNAAPPFDYFAPVLAAVQKKFEAMLTPGGPAR